MKPNRYLGDSVYAEIRDGRVVLTTNNGYPDDPRNVIILEPEVYQALKDFVEGKPDQRADERGRLILEYYDKHGEVPAGLFPKENRERV